MQNIPLLPVLRNEENNMILIIYFCLTLRRGARHHSSSQPFYGENDLKRPATPAKIFAI
jgi:hypothetical protein